MNVEFVWPDCNRIYTNRLDTPIDAFWVECSPDEIALVRPYIHPQADPAVFYAQPCWWRTGKPLTHFFLITRDLQWVWPQGRHVLHSSQWDFNPFRQLPEVVWIENMQQLTQIVIPDTLRTS